MTTASESGAGSEEAVSVSFSDFKLFRSWVKGIWLITNNRTGAPTKNTAVSPNATGVDTFFARR